MSTDPPGDDNRSSEPDEWEISDLIGLELTLALIVWFLLVLVAFFFIGPVVGLLLVAAGVIGFGWALVSAIRRADTTD
jgi:hypothetical protein